MLLKHLFLLPHLLWNVKFEFSWSHNTKQSSEILILKIEMLLEFQDKTNIEIIGFSLMHFRFVLELSDTDLWHTDLLDTHLDLIGTDTPNKYIVCLHNLFKTSSKHVFKTSSRHVFKTSSRHVFRMSSRHGLKMSSAQQFFVFQDVLKKNCYAEEVLKTSSRTTIVCWVVIFCRTATQIFSLWRQPNTIKTK